MQNAQPKIQKMCQEESDDQEAVAKLLQINDSIHRTIDRYKLIKKGDLEGASKIEKGTVGISTGVGKNADNELSLIDFDGDIQPSSAPEASIDATPPKVESLEDDLLGLSFQDKPYGQSGGIALGFGANTSEHRQATPLPDSSNTYRRYTRPVTTLVLDSAKLSQTILAGSYTAYSTNPTNHQAKLRSIRLADQLSPYFTLKYSGSINLQTIGHVIGSFRSPSIQTPSAALPYPITIYVQLRISEASHLYDATTCSTSTK